MRQGRRRVALCRNVHGDQALERRLVHDDNGCRDLRAVHAGALAQVALAAVRLRWIRGNGKLGDGVSVRWAGHSWGLRPVLAATGVLHPVMRVRCAGCQRRMAMTDGHAHPGRRRRQSVQDERQHQDNAQADGPECHGPTLPARPSRRPPPLHRVVLIDGAPAGTTNAVRRLQRQATALPGRRDQRYYRHSFQDPKDWPRSSARARCIPVTLRCDSSRKKPTAALAEKADKKSHPEVAFSA